MKGLVNSFRGSLMTRVSLMMAIFVVFIASISCKHDKNKPKPNPQVEKVELISLKVDGVAITPIKDVMTASNTDKEKVKVELKSSPEGCVVATTPSLSKESEWLLQDGENTLIIDITKDTNKKTYTLKITKTTQIPPDDSAKLVHLSIGKTTKQKDQITSLMEFECEGDEAEVSYETEPSDAKITFTPELKNGKIELKKKEMELKIVVGEGEKKTEYTAKIKKVLDIKSFVNIIFVQSGTRNGKLVEASYTENERILKGESVELSLLGSKANIIMGSFSSLWQSVKINGTEYTKEGGRIVAYGGYKSAIGESITLGNRGETIDVHIEVSDGQNMTSLRFKITRLDETADIPANQLIIRDKNVITSWNLVYLFDGRKPKFDGAEPTNIEVRCPDNAMKSVTINSTPASQVTSKKDAKGNEYWYAEGKVEGVMAAGQNGKDVELVMEPEDANTYHRTTWTFKIVYKEVTDMEVKYEINGKKPSSLPESFTSNIKNGSNPLIELEQRNLNLKLICNGTVENIKIRYGSENETIEEKDLIKDGKAYVLLETINIETEKDINIIITPKDLAVYNKVEYKFRAKGGIFLEDIKPKFVSISGDTNLPKATFLDKLETGDIPVFKVQNNNADILITLTPYEAEFLCKKISINGTEEKLKIIKNITGIYYILAKSIPVNLDTSTKVEIIFDGKTNISNSKKWEFAVQAGGGKPAFPRNFVTFFRVNEVGSLAEPFPADFIDHLIDEENPIHVFDGKGGVAEVAVGCYKDALIKNIEFKLEGQTKHSAKPTLNGSSFISKYSFSFSDNLAHSIQVIIYPENENYAPLTLKFRLQWSGKNKKLPVVFAINDNIRKTGYKGKLNAETARLLVQAKLDLMGEVKIGEKGKEVVCEKKSFQGSTGMVYEASKNVLLLGDNGEEIEKTFVIIVSPKDTENWAETVCEFKLTGKKISDDNAEFVYVQNSGKMEADVDIEPKWKAGFENITYLDNYFMEGAKLKARTLNPRSRVMYKIVDLKGGDIVGQNEQQMQNENGEHTSNLITFFSDKPTKVKAWVISPNNKTDDEKGLWYYTFNPVPVQWSYEDKEHGADYKDDPLVYDKIEVSENKKIYLVFAPWDEESGYTVDLNAVAPHQDPIIKLESLGYWQQYYKTALDVSSLFDSSGTSELEVHFKIMKDNVECFTYKIKVVKK